MNINLENNQIKNNEFISSFIDELKEGILKMENEEVEYTVDRFEGNIAVCEDRSSGKMVNVKKSDLPQNTKEGSILKYKNGSYTIDVEEEKEVSDRIKEKMDKLWNN